jgi:hypothetical protein
MIIGVIIAASIIFALLLTYIFTANKYHSKHEKEMQNCRKDYDHKILSLEDKLKKLAAQHESLIIDHETFLKNNHHDEITLKTLCEEKYKLAHQNSRLQKELYAARKRIKKLLGIKQK